MDFIFDFGNARGKWFFPKAEGGGDYGDFRHAIYDMKEHEWDQVVGRGKPPKGILRINGAPYAVGDAARKYVIKERPKGASRYRPDYYGVGLAFAMTTCFGQGMLENKQIRKRNIVIFGSHAPHDVEYASSLVDAAKGTWEIESEYGRLEFQVVDVVTFDEPLGGYSHFAFTEKGSPQKSAKFIFENDTLVVDAGGYTIDVAAVDEGGNIDILSLESTRSGTIDMTTNFERAMRSANKLLFQDTGDIDVKRIEAAILSGTYQMGKTIIDCSAEAHAALSALTNDVVQRINASGGVANFPYILLTGGGSILLHNYLEQALPRAQFILADPSPERMKYANVFGGAKIAALLRKQELL